MVWIMAHNRNWFNTGTESPEFSQSTVYLYCKIEPKPGKVNQKMIRGKQHEK